MASPRSLFGVSRDDLTCRCVRAGVLIGALLFGVNPLRAQSPQLTGSTFQTRVEELAKALENEPRLKGMTAEQRKARVEFVVGNMLFVLFHEMGHIFITELKLPVLGRDEDAADNFAIIRLLRIGSEFSERVLVEASRGWFLSDRRDRATGDTVAFYDEHDLGQQRAYWIVCMMVGSDPVKYKGLADETKMPEQRREGCKDDFAEASRSWEMVLEPHRRTPDQPKTTIDVRYGEGKGPLAVYARSFSSIHMLDTVAQRASDQYVWPAPFTLETQTCGRPGAHWDEKTRTLTLCYEQGFDFAELYRAYGAAPLVDSSPPQAKSGRPPSPRRAAK